MNWFERFRWKLLNEVWLEEIIVEVDNFWVEGLEEMIKET